MSEQPVRGIYLIVEFDWPASIEPDIAQKAARLHQVLQNQTWIAEFLLMMQRRKHAAAPSI